MMGRIFWVKRINKLFLLSIAFLFSTGVYNAESNNAVKDERMQWVSEHIGIAKDSLRVYELLHQGAKDFAFEDPSETLAVIYHHLAIWHNNYGKMDSAVFYLKKVKEIYTGLNLTEKHAETCFQLANYYSSIAEYAEAMNVIFDALKIHQESNNIRGIGLCYAHLCDLLYSQYKFEEGNVYCEQAIEIQSQLNVPMDLALSYRYKSANLLFIDGQVENALKTINQAIDIYDELGETGPLRMAVINWRGNVLKYLDRFDEALADYKSNLAQSEEMGFTRYSLVSLANIGHVFTMQGNYEDALPFSLKAIDIMERTGNTKNLWENYMHVANCYEELGQFENALKYSKLHTEFYVDFLNSNRERLESELVIKYESEKNLETIQRQETQIAQQRKVQILYISLGFVMLVSLAGMINSIRSIRKKRKALQQLNTQLDARNHQNELLMKEIHHRVKNNLEMVKSLIALQCAQLEDSTTKDAMIESQNRVQSMGIIHQKLYQGDNLGSIEMKDYFVNLSEGILDAFDAEEKVKIECAMDNLDLDIDTAVPIGLIVNELLTNALKYAFPENAKGLVQISLAQPNSSILTLTVTDNGIGKTIGLMPKGTGFGSQLISLLTRQLNGEMKEEINNGTSTHFEFKTRKAA